MNKFIEYFARQGAFVNIITIFVTVVGIYSIVKIQREVFPNINFDVITITTRYAGASAESTERLITNPLEQDLREVDGIKKMTSISAESTSVIVMQLDPDQTTAEDAEADIQDVVDAFRDLPEDADDPDVLLVESKLRPTITVSLSGQANEETLRREAKKLERIIENVRQVAKVNYNGKRDYEIQVQANPQKMKRFRITLAELIQSLRKNNLNLPGGTIEALEPGREEVIVRTIGELNTVDDIENTVIRANSLAAPITVKNVARVEKKFVKRKLSYRTNASPAISLTVLKKDGADAITLVDRVKEVVNAYESKMDAGIKIDFIADSSYFVRRRLKVLSNNLLVGLGLVLIILSLVLPWRVAAVTAFGIPFSFLGALSLFYFGEVSLNLISMMGLIIVVGMLVDDAVVITENIQAERERGLPPLKAAITGTQGIWAPVTASVLTTVMAFAPMLYMSGIFGKFIRYIPIGVILALLVSLVECFFILPHHMAHWVKPQNAKRKIGGFFSRVWDGKIVPLYEFILNRLLKFRYGVLLATFAIFAGAIFLVKNKMDFILFPPGAIDTFIIKIETAIGTPLAETEKRVLPIEEKIKGLPESELLDFTAQIGLLGQGGVKNTKRGGNYAMLTVYLTAETERQRKASEIIEELRTKIGTPDGITKISFERQKGGPPVGKPVSIGVRSDDYNKIMPAVEEVKQKLKTLEGLSDITDTFIEGKEEIHVELKKNEAAAAGISLADVGTAIRSSYEGVRATSIRTLDEEIDVNVTLDEERRASKETISQLKVANNRGNLISLPKVVRTKSYRGIATYEHENNQRQVTVNGEIDTKVNNARNVNRVMKKWVKDIEKKYPDVSFSFGGEGADTKESLQTLIESFAFAFFGILLLLILLFKNIYQPLLIASTIPLGVTSVILAFFLHQMPLTFLALIGVIALAGVIVNNAIVMIDFINKARRNGQTHMESIKTGAKKRLRPIFLTTVTTTAGILPTAYGVGGLDPFVVPIALALGWGILFGSVLTTLVLPPLTAIMDDILRIFMFVQRKVSGVFPHENQQ